MAMVIACDVHSRAAAAAPWNSSCRIRRSRAVRCRASDKRTPPTAEASLPVKLTWYFSEAFGDLASIFRNKEQLQQQESQGTFEDVISRQAAAECIREDYDKSYFVTGNMTTAIYKDDCEFADPFVSFRGLKRFRKNVSNLGSFMEKSNLKIRDWMENEDSILVKWKFSCVLALPWRPIISATGSTEYYFDADSGKICKHVESWDITPADGVRQLFKRSRK